LPERLKNIPMKKTLLSFVILVLSYTALAQGPMVVQSNSKGLYLTHTVHAKDNFYSIGRMYAISPKEIAAFNSIDMAAGLSVGQSIMIPLTAANFSQKGGSGTPVYYVVGEREGLYRVSSKNGNVLMATLRKWNKLADDNLKPGQKLIVGYLQGKGAENTAAVAKAESPKTEPAKAEAAPEKEPVIYAEPDPIEEAPKKPAPKPTEAAPATRTANKPVASGGAGYFKNQFDLQSKAQKGDKDATVTSGIFKTTSGWQDAKYYALMDKVEPGTIVQVVNPVNNKSIYAKVLGEMSGIRQNQGLELRISNAAATALDISDPDKFIVRVLY
jgi:LysM repeat protein